MKYFKWFVLFFSLFTTLVANILAKETNKNIYNQIIFFGDSLTDNGNFFGFDMGIMPKSPPYFRGRFSNGLVWSEYVEKYFYDTEYVKTINYAFSGETVILHNPFDGYLPITFRMSVDAYLLRSFLQKRSHFLFIIWLGANDYLLCPANVEEITARVVDKMKDNIEYLIAHGARHFLILNIPDLAKTPYGYKHIHAKRFTQLSLMHDIKLRRVIQEIKKKYTRVNIRLFDARALFDALIDSKIIFHANDSCWEGGYTLRNEQMNEVTLAKNLENDYRNRQDVLKSFSSKELAHFIAGTPALREAYMVTQKALSGVKPCENPDDYIFWDSLHPSAMMHKLLGQEIIHFINQHLMHAAEG